MKLLTILMEKENSVEFLDVPPKIINGLRHGRVNYKPKHEGEDMLKASQVRLALFRGC